MASPKSGTAAQAVSPAAPDTPKPADTANPGGSSTVQANPSQNQTGPGSSAQVQANQGSSDQPYKPDPTKKSWIEIAMVDENQKPVPGEHYRITLPDGTVAEGTLDQNGVARVSCIDPGTCQITFPDLDQDAWETA